MKRIIFRCDLGASIGMGHFMRCLALAQCCREAQGEVAFILAQENAYAQARLEHEGIRCEVLAQTPGSVEDARATLDIVEQIQGHWLIVDGYHFNKSWFSIVSEMPTKVGLWTDYVQETDLGIDLVINQNEHATSAECRAISPDAKHLFGLRHFVLRKEFRAKIKSRSPKNRHVSRLLITLGGADPENTTCRIVQALKNFGRLESIDVVVGANNSHLAQIRALVAGDEKVVVHRNVENMPGLMEAADLAISAAGITLWELAYMGVPTLTVVLAENQKPLAQAAEALSISKNLGWAKDLDEGVLLELLGQLMRDDEALRSMSVAGIQAVDGVGAERISDYLLMN